MARKVVVSLEVFVSLIDDFDGGGAGETVRFALDGTHYEIDLSSQNAEQLRASMATYVAVARQPARPPQDTEPSRAGSGSPRARVRPESRENYSLRQWARSQGFTVCDRGRIPTAMREFYRQQA